MEINSKLTEIEEQLKIAINIVKDMNRIEGDTTELNLERIEKKVLMLVELVDFRMGKYD